MKTGERIRELRKKRGLTLNEIGERVNLSYGTIASIETGKSEASTETIIKLSKVFEVSTDYILTGEEKTKNLNKEEEEIITVIREDKAVYEALKTLAESKKKVIKFATQYSRATPTHSAGIAT